MIAAHFDQAAFARSLRVRAAELGISGRTAAAQAGVSVPSWNRYTRGHPPDVENYLRCLAWLDRTTPAGAQEAGR